MKMKRLLPVGLALLLLCGLFAQAALAEDQTPTLTAHLNLVRHEDTASYSWSCPHAQDYLHESFIYYEDIYGPGGLITSKSTPVYSRLSDLYTYFNEVCELYFAQYVTEPGAYYATVQYCTYSPTKWGPVDTTESFVYCGLNVGVNKENGVELGTVTVNTTYNQSAVKNLGGYDLLDVQGHTATLTAVPKDGYYFAGWKKNGQWTTDYEPTLQVTLWDSEVSYEAVFEKIPTHVVSEISASFAPPPAGPREGAGLSYRFKVASGSYTEKYPYQEAVYFINADGTRYTGNFTSGQTLTMKVHLSVMVGYQHNTVYTTYSPNYRGAADVTLALTMNGETNTYQSNPNEGDNRNAYFYIPVTIHDACQVTFKANGHGTLSETSQTVTYGEKVVRPANPSASGYRFVGWYTNAACTQRYDFSSAVTESFTLYAGWSSIVDRVDIWTEGPITGATVGSIRTYSLSDQVALTNTAWMLNDMALSSTVKFMAGNTYALVGLLKANSVTLTLGTEVYVNGILATNEHAASGRLAFAVNIPALPLASHHVVSFNMGGLGEQIAPQRVQHGAPAWEPPAPEDDGGEFEGYTVTRIIDMGRIQHVFEVPYDFSNPVTRNVTINCNWTKYVQDLSVGFYAPEAGETVSAASFYALGEGFDVSENVVWHDENGDMLSENDAFNQDETYTFTLFLTPKQGYKFSPNFSDVTVDGATISMRSIEMDGTMAVFGSYTIQDMVSITFDANGRGTAPRAVRVPYGTNLYEMDIPTMPSGSSYIFENWYLEPACVNYYAACVDTTDNYALRNDVTFYAKWMEIDYEGGFSLYVKPPKAGAQIWGWDDGSITGEDGTESDRYHFGVGRWRDADHNEPGGSTFVAGQTYAIELDIVLTNGKALPETVTALVNGESVTFTRNQNVLYTASAWYECAAGDVATISFDTGRVDAENPPSIAVPVGTTFGEAFDIRFGGGLPDPGYSDGQLISGWLLNGHAVDLEETVSGDVTLVAHWCDVVWSAELTLDIPAAGDAIGTPSIHEPAGQEAFEGFGVSWLNEDGTPASGAFEGGATYLCHIEAHAWAGKVFGALVWVDVNGETFHFTGDRLIVSADIPVAVEALVTISFESGISGVAAPDDIVVPAGTAFGGALLGAFEGEIPCLPAADGQVMIWWTVRTGDGETLLELSAPVEEDVTLCGVWRELVSRVDVKLALPLEGEFMLPQLAPHSGEGWDGNGAWFETGDGGFFSGAWAEGDVVVLNMGMLPADGMALASLDGETLARVFVNGVEADVAASNETADGAPARGIWITLPLTVPATGGALTLPSALDAVGEEAFAGTDAWTVELPDGVTSVGARAFANCPNLQRVTLPAALTDIADDAFAGCPDSLMIVTDSAALIGWAEARGILVYHEPAG